MRSLTEIVRSLVRHRDPPPSVAHVEETTKEMARTATHIEAHLDVLSQLVERMQQRGRK